MFHHVYSRLVMLVKTSHPNKNVLDMNKHYLELQTFLTMVERNPEAAMDQNLQVFPSEKTLYGNDKKVNHHLRPFHFQPSSFTEC